MYMYIVYTVPVYIHVHVLHEVLSLQERYLASLMPLKRDVSPWRVCCI